MTPEQVQAFRDDGCIYLPSALTKKEVQPVKEHVLNELKRQNIWAAGRTLSQKMKGVPMFQQTGKLSQLIQYQGLKEKVINTDLYSGMCHLADAPLKSADCQLLISLPHKVDWCFEGLNWHRDVSKAQLKRIPGVQAFVLVDNVAARGGATLALAGSHRLDNQSQAKHVLSEFIQRGETHRVSIAGNKLSIIEMSGRAGDVYLMDMRVLHTPSINSSKDVRIMATSRFFLE